MASTHDHDTSVPALFTPVQLRSLRLPNRIVVSPMGMYASAGCTGHTTPFHIMHIGHLAFRGAALTIMEVSAVLPAGRTSPADLGIWSDDHISSLKKIVDFVHEQKFERKIGIQLGHSGRKGGLMPHYPGVRARIASPEEGGWEAEVMGPSAVKYMEEYIMPRAMTKEEIKSVVKAHGDAAMRAVKAGFDLIEVHAAHGYLLSEFHSPVSNYRTDDYGGSLDNRIRFTLEVVTEIRSRILDTMPLSVRISATEFMEHSPSSPQWTIDDSITLALRLSDMGVDLIDVSAASNNPQQKIPADDAFYQVKLAHEIKKALKKEGKSMMVAAVGKIDNAAMAEGIIQDEKADVVLVGRQFLRDPNLVRTWAEELGVEMAWPMQYIRLGNKPMGTL